MMGSVRDIILIGVPAACRSDDVGAVALGGMEKEELKGLDVSVFSRAPPQALLTTLEHLKCASRPPLTTLRALEHLSCCALLNSYFHCANELFPGMHAWLHVQSPIACAISC